MRDMKAKIMVSGKVVEAIEWSVPILYDYTVENKSRRGKVAGDDWKGKDDSNLKRAQTNLRRLVWANQTRYSKFVTFTYKDAEPDLDNLRKDWKAFQQRMRREGYSSDYVAVLEWQEEREIKHGEKSLHIHAVLFTDRFIPCEFISNAWQKGFIQINAMRDVKNLGAYVSKYLTKTTLAMYGTHSYFCSRGLKRPLERKMSTHGELQDSLQELNSQGFKMQFQRDFIITATDEGDKLYQINQGTYMSFTKL